MATVSLMSNYCSLCDTTCHSLGRKKSKPAFAPSCSSSVADWCICYIQQLLVLILAENQNCKSTGMQSHETGWACVIAYCSWEEQSCFLFDSFFTHFSYLSAHFFPSLAPTLRDLYSLGYMFSSKWYLPGPCSGTDTSRQGIAPSYPSHSWNFQCLVATYKLPMGNGSWSVMILQLFLGIVGREVVNLGQNHPGVITTIYL